MKNFNSAITLILGMSLAACVNINGIRNPTVPRTISKDIYNVDIGFRLLSDARSDLFLFCDNMNKLYKEMSVKQGDITFACYDQNQSISNKRRLIK